MRIGDYIRSQRAFIGNDFTQEKLAEAVGVSRQTIMSIESNATDSSFAKIMRIVRVLQEHGAQPLKIEELEF